jgi:hypothetical protein
MDVPNAALCVTGHGGHDVSAEARVPGVASTDAPGPGPMLVAWGIVAVALPTLIAFNVPPSATFFNQAAAFVGWGGFLLLLGILLPSNAARAALWRYWARSLR